MKRLIALLFSSAALAGTTPNMGLVKPDLSDTNYRQKIDTILNQIDAHSHISGQGVLITSSGIANGAITTSKIADRSVTSAKIALGGVSTAQIADSAITISKRASMSVTSQYASLGNVAVAPIATMSTTTSNFVNITNQQIGLASSGRPIAIGVKPYDTSPCFFSSGVGVGSCHLQWLADGVAQSVVSYYGEMPCSAISTSLPIASGSHIYALQIKRSAISGVTCSMQGAGIFGYEL